MDFLSTKSILAATWDVKEHGGQDEHGRQVDRHGGLEEEGLEEAGDERHDDEEEGGQEHRQHRPQQSSTYLSSLWGEQLRY